MAKVLIIDGNGLEQKELTGILKKEYDVVNAWDGQKGWAQIESLSEELAAVFLRMSVLGLDGKGILEKMMEKDLLRRITVVIVEGENDPETEDSVFSSGVSGFIRAPFRERDLLRYLKNDRREREYRMAILKKLSQQNEMAKKQYLLLQKQSEELRESRSFIVEALGTVVEYRNLENGDHVRRVRTLTELLGNQVMQDFPEYKLTKEQIAIFGFSSMLHDVGKISIPDSIMLKPGKLNEDEIEIMRAHTTKGCEILEQVSSAWPQEYHEAAMDICRHHHERFDGRGYPDGLEGEDIPVSAQLVSLADAYDALVSERVYKKAYPKDRAYEMIVTGECGEFNPKILDSFRKCREAFEALIPAAEEVASDSEENN